MASAFNPANWYWFVGGNETQAFSSASGTFVPASDSTFQSWLAAGNTISRIDTVINLAGVLADNDVRPTDPAVLDAYQDAQALDIITMVLFRILFNHENRLRAVERALALNGSPPNLTPAQARAAVKALM